MAAVRTWSLVLAGGEGSRLRSLTTKPCGTAVPKQFCSFNGGRTLLEDAVARANAISSPDHTCVIVAERHRHWWSAPLAHLPERNVIVQPCNRGTGIGILYPLLHILVRDPNARLVILPSDHYVRQEQVLQQSMHSAVRLLAHDDDAPILLGLEPDEADPELGYIIPGELDGAGRRSILRFIEKPSAQVARGIIRQGGLWNTFIIAGSGQGLLNLFEQRYPELVAQMRDVVTRVTRGLYPGPALSELYGHLPQIDFSRDVLEVSSSSLRLVRIPACGWSDLGTPKRVAEALRRLQPHELRFTQTAPANGPINLARQHAHLERLAGAGAGPGRSLSMSG